MDEITKKIWVKFHIHHGDSLPFSPWLEGACRNHIAELFRELGYKKGAEIGVRTGEFTQVMFEANPGVEILAVDPWAPYARVSQQRQDRYFRYCQQRLAPYKAELMKMTSMEAAPKVPDGSLDFVYIDGEHSFRNVILDIIFWADKVRRGGIVSGHDFYHHYNGGVVVAVESYTRAYGINPWYITRELTPSWFWVKQ